MNQILKEPVIYGLVGGVFFLLLSTFFTFILKLKNPKNETFDKVLRIIGGWWIIAGLLVFAILLGQTGLILLFLIASLLALKEYLNVQKLQFVGQFEFVLMCLLTVVHYSFVLFGKKNYFLFIVPLMCFIYLPFFFLARRKINGLIQNLWAAQSGLMLCVYFMSFVPGLLFLNDSDPGLRKIDLLSAFLFLFFITELNDVFQFITGKMFGKIKLVAEISPNKTLAGFLGGIFFTSLLSLFLAPLLLEINPGQAIILGICLSISGMSGDLMFSALKRTHQIKDFSDLIPGHGGALDRLDSIIFTAPTLYSVMYIFIHS